MKTKPKFLHYGTRRELLLITLALPSFIGVMVFFLIPFAMSLHMAVIDNPIGRNFVGLEHFARTFDNAAFQLGFRNTLRFMLFSVPFNMALALLIATLLQSTNNIIKNILSVCFLLPLVIPSGSMVHFWRSIFGFNGVINGLFFAYYPVNLLNTDHAMFVVAFIFIWKNIGFNIVLYLSGLSLIPKEYYEFASVEGAGKLAQFWHITFMYLVPTTFTVFFMSIILSFRAFREIFLLTGAHPHFSIYTLQHYMNNMFAALNYQRLASASYILTACIVLVVIAVFYIQRRVLRYD